MLQPLDDRIVVKPGKEEEVTKGGILLPDTAKKKPREGEVLAVGPGKFLENGERAPMEVAVGDVVVYSEYSGTIIEIGGDEFARCPKTQLAPSMPQQPFLWESLPRAYSYITR